MPRVGHSPSKNFAGAEPTVFFGSVGSGMGMTAPAGTGRLMSFFFLLPAGGGWRSTSLMVAGPLFFLAPSRSARVWPKNAAIPQKSLVVHLSLYGWVWHSAHWSGTPMNRLAAAPVSLAGDGRLLSWLART